MSTQPEALRLAEFCDGNVLYQPAAAELRRLHASCEDYAQHKQRQDQRVLALTAQRDALLEALKLALSSHGVMLTSYPPQDAWKFYGVEEKARAATKMVEEGK